MATAWAEGAGEAYYQTVHGVKLILTSKPRARNRLLCIQLIEHPYTRFIVHLCLYPLLVDLFNSVVLFSSFVASSAV